MSTGPVGEQTHAGDVAVPVHVIKVTDADVNAQADGSLHNRV